MEVVHLLSICAFDVPLNVFLSHQITKFQLFWVEEAFVSVWFMMSNERASCHSEPASDGRSELHPLGTTYPGPGLDLPLPSRFL